MRLTFYRQGYVAMDFISTEKGELLAAGLEFRRKELVS
jgi:hypothetical protein